MNDKVIIIAEAGVNHNGSFDRACEMIIAAKKAGADYIKFQTAIPELVISSIAPKAKYQADNTGDSNQSQLEMCKALHLPLSDYKRLKEICQKEGIGFMSTPFDLVSIDFLASLGQDYFKIPSGEITNLPYLRKIAQIGCPVILSTGMSEMTEIETCIKVLTGTYSDTHPRKRLQLRDITVLHCNTEYPTPYEDVNLRAMIEIREALGVKVGYSDHTLGIEIPIAAVAMGATVIEKHFTLSRQLSGPDHKASLEPEELKDMVKAIRNVGKAMGSKEKIVSPSEAKNKDIARKSIVASRDIRKGEILDETNITVKRPGNGISPMRWDEVIGKIAIKDFPYDSLIEI